MTNNLAFCFTCVKASKLENVKICASRRDNAFLSRGFSNWKDACGDKTGRFPVHKRSQQHEYSVGLLK